MSLDIENREWKEFIICEELQVNNSKAYHKESLIETDKRGISYITRTNLRNGVESIVEREVFKINKANTIVFGAENATFFYQPNEYITGNKMYFIQHKNLNKYSGLFLQLLLNNSIKHCGFGYGKGLTGTRVQRRYISLPINSKNEPDYKFMEQYMRHKEQAKQKEYQNYIKSRIQKLKNTPKTVGLNKKEWGEFFLNEIFTEIQRGKRLKTADHKKGNQPYISSTGSNNGLDGYVGNKESVRIFKNCITLANSGSVGSCFYQPYSFVASDHVTKLENRTFSKSIYLFISFIVSRLGEKYSFNREMNDTRIKREKIMLPINESNEPDYIFMENYMRYVEYKKLIEYLQFKKK